MKLETMYPSRYVCGRHLIVLEPDLAHAGGKEVLTIIARAPKTQK